MYSSHQASSKIKPSSFSKMRFQGIAVFSFLLFVSVEGFSLEEDTGISEQEAEGYQFNDYIEDEKDLDYLRPEVVENKFDETAPIGEPKSKEPAPEEGQEESASGGGGLQLSEDSQEQDPSIFMEELERHLRQLEK